VTGQPPTIFAADVIRVLGRLRCTDTETAEAAARLLGIAVPGPADASQDAHTASADPADLVQDGQPQRPGGTHASGSTMASTAGQLTEPSDWIPLRRRDTLAAIPGWWPGAGDEAGNAPREANEPRSGAAGPEEAAGGGLSPGVPPLFPVRASRVIIATAFAVTTEGDELDLDLIIASLARLEPLAELPRRMVRTNRRGVQVLLDLGPAMRPYLADLAALPAQLRRVLGPRVEVLRFARCPIAGVGPGLRPWDRYRPPAPGTPVLVVTDFGGGHPWAPPPAPPDEWAAFVAEVRRVGCRPLALVPGARRDADPALTRLMPVLPWDASTTVRDAVRASP